MLNTLFVRGEAFHTGSERKERDMWLLAQSPHRYYHREELLLYLFPAGEAREVPEEVGQLLLRAHPNKFALVDFESYGAESSRGTGMEAPPQDRAVRRAGKPRKVSQTSTSKRGAK